MNLTRSTTTMILFISSRWFAHFLNSQLNATHIVDYCGKGFELSRHNAITNCCEPKMLCHNHSHFRCPHGIHVGCHNKNPWAGLLRLLICDSMLKIHPARFSRLLCVIKPWDLHLDRTSCWVQGRHTSAVLKLGPGNFFLCHKLSWGESALAVCWGAFKN